MSEEHREVVRAGVDAIADWRRQHPDVTLHLAGAKFFSDDFRNADLSNADLTNSIIYKSDLSGANLRSVDFSGANLEGTNLSDADLTGARFVGAKLHATTFRGATLNEADLTRADVSYATLSGATLMMADLTGANLEGTDLSHAKLYALRIMQQRSTWAQLQDLFWPSNFWFTLDRNHIRDTRFDADSFDPYSILRRTYTGPKLTFVFFFSVLALLPLIGQAMFWSAVSHTEARFVPVAVRAVERTAEFLEREQDQDQETQDWVKSAKEIVAALQGARLIQGEWSAQLQDLLTLIQKGRELIERRRQQFVEDAAALARLDAAASRMEQAQALLNVAAPESGIVMEERRVWELVVGVKRGLAQTILAVVLLLYNVARALLTYRMSSLRDNEERTGDSPAWDEYRWLWQVHRVANLALIISVASGLWRIGEMLSSVVLVPA